jgi:pseudouridine synthase
MSEKLQKVLARVGLGSRRYMEEVIAAGRVSVNGQIAQVGERIEPGDELRIDGRKVAFQIEDEIRRRVIIYYKPEGEICSRSDPENRPTVFEQLPAIPGDRWVMVGRLDINSTGLLLFTNDGELANRLMHPSNEIEREYAVRVMGEVTPQIRNNMLKGVVLDDGPAKANVISDLPVRPPSPYSRPSARYSGISSRPYKTNTALQSARYRPVTDQNRFFESGKLKSRVGLQNVLIRFQMPLEECTDPLELYPAIHPEPECAEQIP